MQRIAIGRLEDHLGDRRGLRAEDDAFTVDRQSPRGDGGHQPVVIAPRRAVLLQLELESSVVRVYEDQQDEVERLDRQFSVSTYFTNATDTGRQRIFQIGLVEIEDFHPTGLSIGGREFPAPYRYTERWRSTGLELVARVEVSRAQLEQLYDLSITDPHEVVRHGISEAPRSMSLLFSAWSPGSEGSAACELWLNDPRDVDNDWALVA